MGNYIHKPVIQGQQQQLPPSSDSRQLSGWSFYFKNLFRSECPMNCQCPCCLKHNDETQSTVDEDRQRKAREILTSNADPALGHHSTLAAKGEDCAKKLSSSRIPVSIKRLSTTQPAQSETTTNGNTYDDGTTANIHKLDNAGAKHKAV